MKIEPIPGTWVIEAFRRGGVNTDQLTQQYPDDVYRLLYDMYTFPPDNINRLLLACSEMSGDKHFGLTMNERLDVSMYGLIGYIMLNSSTVHDLCKNIAHYYTIFYSGGPSFEFTVHKDNASVKFRTNHPEKVPHRHQIEWSIGAIPYFLSQSVGKLSQPLSTSFTFDQPQNLDKLISVFGDNIKFNQIENKIIYSKSIINKKINNVNSAVLKVLIDEADSLLKNFIKNESFLEKIQLLLIKNIGENSTNAPELAKELNLTLSSFKRKMVRENIDFRKVKETVKNDLAIKLLSKTNESINNVARKTGFSDQSSFTRFFIRCNKISPQIFRNNLSK